MTTTQVRTIDKSLQKAFNLLDELKESLGYETRQEAFVALRAVLKTLRDRMPVGEATDFASQLPLLLKGIYYDGWKPKGEPVRLRSSAEFLGYVNEQINDTMEPEKVTWHVFKVLKNHISEGEIEDIIANMPSDMKAFFK